MLPSLHLLTSLLPGAPHGPRKQEKEPLSPFTVIAQAAWGTELHGGAVLDFFAQS